MCRASPRGVQTTMDSEANWFARHAAIEKTGSDAACLAAIEPFIVQGGFPAGEHRRGRLPDHGCFPDNSSKKALSATSPVAGGNG
jgi:hypothetical protein